MDTKTSRKSFLSFFDSWTLAKGEDYFRRGKVLHQSSSSDEMVDGIVAGSGGTRYRTVLYLAKHIQEIDTTTCSCPVHVDCKHAAALAFHFLNHNHAAGSPQSYAVSRVKSAPGVAVSKSTIESTLSRSGEVTTGDGTLEIGDFDADNIARLADAVVAEDVVADGPIDTFAQVKNSYRRLAGLFSAAESLGDSETFVAIPKPAQRAQSSIVYVINEWFGSARPFIEPKRVSLRKDGSYGTESTIRIEQLLESSRSRYVTEADQQVGSLWSAVGAYSARSGHAQHAIDAEPDLFTLLLTRIISTGRCYFQSKDSQPLKLGRPLEGKVIWQEIQHHQRLAVIGIDEGPDYRNEHLCLRWRYPWYINREDWTCGPVSVNLTPSQIEAILTVSPVSKKEAPAVQLFFAEIGLDRVIPPPKTHKKIEVRIVSPRHSLRIEVMKGIEAVAFGDEVLSKAGVGLKVAAVTTVYPEISGIPIEFEDGRLVLEKPDPRPLQIVPIFEKMGFREIAASVFGLSDLSVRYFVPTNHLNWIDFATRHVFQLRESGWSIPEDIDDQFQFVEFESKDLTVKFESKDSWWFSVSLSLNLDGREFSLLPILMHAIYTLPRTDTIDAHSIEALNRHGKFIWVLPNGKLFCIPFERIRSILIAVQEVIFHDGEGKNARISILDAAALLECELLTNARWLGAERMLKMIDCLRQLTMMRKIEAPKKFLASLRPYQIDGLSWLQVLAQNGFGGILADDMGLGKTVQLLAHICLEKQNKKLKTPFLVICPTSVLPNWLSEAAKFCPHLKVVPFSGPTRMQKWPQAQKADVVVSSYALILRDLEQFKSIHWHGIALDESQYIKNPKSNISKVIGSIPANHRFCMTGTPIENHLGELWSQFRFLMPGLLGKLDEFNDSFRKPIEEMGSAVRKEILTRRIRPFLMRRTKASVAAELPEKTTIIEAVELEGAQRDLYETVRLASTKSVRAEIQQKGIKSSQLIILHALLQLRQVCCDPRLVKLTAARDVTTSTKLELLVSKIAELVAEGRRTIVFSQFTSMLDLVAAELRETRTPFVEIRGSTKDRVTPVQEFQAGNVPVFLISLKAGGTGLNLTAADTVIHYDPWWNPAVEEQATDRAHRIGQTKNVFVYKLIAEGTIEQRMLELQERKRKLAKSILDDSGGINMSFTEGDLEFLLAPLEPR